MTTKPIPVIPSPMDKTGWVCPTNGTDLPYLFVPCRLDVNSDFTLDNPVNPIWHDGANPGQDALYSGELNCTLRALSPLLVGNQQVPWATLAEQVRKDVLKKMSRHCAESIRDDKAVTFPLRLLSGEVLLPGESLKGMLRHGLGALLGTPIERVNEGRHSYRPNVFIPDPRSKSKHASVPTAARVVAFDESTCEMTIQLIRAVADEQIGDLGHVEFVKLSSQGVNGEAEHKSLAPGQAIGDLVERVGPGWRKTNQPGRSAWTYVQSAVGGTALAEPRYWLRYHFGLDEGQQLMKAYLKAHDVHNIDTRPHPSVLVRKDRCGGTIKVDEAVVAQYLETRRHLCDESAAGHLGRQSSSRQPTGPIRIPMVEKDDLIFCEWMKRGPGPDDGKVLSFGHNFRYRWKHLDDVTVRAIAYDAHAHRWVFERRPEMRAHPDESPGGDGRPKKLTRVRAMLGYVVEKDGRNPSLGGPGGSEPDRLQKLSDPFDRLAGRLSFNFGLERVKGGQDARDNSRFVQGRAGAYIFLHPLAAGKASSFRTYVPGEHRSWGEGIRLADDSQAIWVQNVTGLSAGRKFYAHQGYTSDKPSSGLLEVPQHHFDLISLLEHRELASLTATRSNDLRKFVANDQARIAHGISPAGTEFGFTVRFRELRAWELAALIAVLEPGRLASIWKSPSCPVDGKWFANKLGAGRPLGLGSVQVSIDRALRWPQTGRGGDQIIDSAAQDNLLKDDLAPLLNDDVVKAWLDVHRVDRTDTRRPYLLHRADDIAETSTYMNNKWRRAHSNWTRETGLWAP